MSVSVPAGFSQWSNSKRKAFCKKRKTQDRGQQLGRQRQAPFVDGTRRVLKRQQNERAKEGIPVTHHGYWLQEGPPLLVKDPGTPTPSGQRPEGRYPGISENRQPASYFSHQSERPSCLVCTFPSGRQTRMHFPERPHDRVPPPRARARPGPGDRVAVFGPSWPLRAQRRPRTATAAMEAGGERAKRRA